MPLTDESVPNGSTCCSPGVTCDVLSRYTITASVSVQMQAEVAAAAEVAVLMLGSLLRQPAGLHSCKTSPAGSFCRRQIHGDLR
jgi:hypothetical protein